MSHQPQTFTSEPLAWVRPASNTHDAIDPRRIWILVVAVTALGWVGYLAVRMLGPGRGLPVAGLAGGFVSGAATTGAMVRQARDPALRRAGLAAALLASMATLIQLVLVTAVADRRVALLLAPAAAAGVAVLTAEAYQLVRSRPVSTVESKLAAVDRAAAPPEPPATSPAEPPATSPAEPPATSPATSPGAPVAAPAARRPFALVPALLLACWLSCSS